MLFSLFLMEAGRTLYLLMILNPRKGGETGGVVAMYKSAIILAVILLFGAMAIAQKQLKPWTEWSRKDAEKILNDSPWGQTQVETDTSEMVFTPTTQTGGGDSGSRREQGATNQATSVKFRICWLSARPIRQALARQTELESGTLTEQLRFFAEGPSDKRTVIAVSFESSDRRFEGKVMQGFNSANTGVLKNSTYLERKDGKRIFLQEYVPPQQNRLGVALFVFPRTVDERPLLNAESGSVRFHTEYENKTTLDESLNPGGQNSSRQASSSPSGVTNPYRFKLDMRFKVAEMIYNGQLEY
jgi:hypothetical protein